MSLTSRALGRLLKFPEATTHRVAVEQLQIPMPDGVNLVADRWYPQRDGAEAAPVLLTRTPYGRKLEGMAGRLLAERGFQYVIVSCRGTFGSGGRWEPFWSEKSDGKAVFAWLAEQPWFPETVATLGASYTGFTQWSVAADLPPYVKAMSLGVTSSNFRDFVHPSGVFALADMLAWTRGLETQQLPRRKRRAARRGGKKALARAAATIPPTEADVSLLGRHVSYFQDWLTHDGRDDSLWMPIDFGPDVAAVVPANMHAGWYDVFLTGQLRDFQAAKAAGRSARLTVGPWVHSSVGNFATYLRETIHWMTAHLTEARVEPLAEVRVFVMGARRWIDLADWPPPAEVTTYHLQPDSALSATPAPASPPDTYRYDPHDPTPSVGGALLLPRSAGPKDNRKLEQRADVLTYTTSPLAEDVTVVGTVNATLHVRSSLGHTDFFVRLCDVAPNGRSINVCDGLQRVRPGSARQQADGTLRLELELSPIANTFVAGHRIRVQVSSGAHPRYARNTGSGEPHATARTLVVADQEIFHDADHPSAISLPMLHDAVSPPPRGRTWRILRSRR